MEKNSFKEQVFAVVARIPEGQVATYGQVAELAGHPGAARAVGNILHTNTDPVAVPCHRVVDAQGRPGRNYGLGGPRAQLERLRAEGVRIVDGKVDLHACAAGNANARTSLVSDIPFASIPGVSVGNAQNGEAGTGVTVFRFTLPARAAVEVYGGGPASRETESIAPERNHPLNALVFSGGSAYGLAASDGVARCLEEHGVGYDTGIALVPIVCQSCIYDLGYGSASVRPDAQMGYEACQASFSRNAPCSGNTGAGTGATVGKAAGMKQAQKTGIGYAAARLGELLIGVSAVLNSYGDIYAGGQKIAGMLTPDRAAFADSYEALLQTAGNNLFTGNTTLAAVFTNGNFSPAELKHLARMASAGLSRSIRPVFTTADGDTVYAVSVGPEAEKVPANLDAAGALSARLLEEAIADAVHSAQTSEQAFLKMISTSR